MTRGPERGGRVRVFSLRQLPSGFLRSLDNPPVPPAFPRPSATLALLREEKASLEVLLLRRSPRSGFIPGAWVFPGGTVDPEDSDRHIFPRLHGITPEIARNCLGPGEPEPPALAYWLAALRETFEETGVLLHRRASRDSSPSRRRLKAEALARTKLLADAMSFRDVLETLDVTLDAGALEYIGHWITPECEPRRYDTRFFAAEVGADTQVTPHQKEMVEAQWLNPAEALSRNREGTLPLVFPTVFTLEELEPFKTPREALGFLRGRPVPRRLPILERTELGIGFRLAD